MIHQPDETSQLQAVDPRSPLFIKEASLRLFRLHYQLWTADHLIAITGSKELALLIANNHLYLKPEQFQIIKIEIGI